MPMVIGLTGGIGSGKTAVSDRFARLGTNIVDADIVARKVVEPGTIALQQIHNRFGDIILLDDGDLNRAALRKIVFDNPDERVWLEGVTHPAIGTELIHQLESATSPYVILVSPLLIEAGHRELCRRVLVVDVPVAVQIERTVARDSNDRAQVERIIASQASREQRLNAAHDVIDNALPIERLDEQVQRLHSRYLELANDQ